MERSTGLGAMTVGLGLPIGDTDVLLDWARRADAGPFSTLALLDRLVWDSPEPLVGLAAVAGATARIAVQTEVLLVPLRDPTLLAKQVATLDRLAAGRLLLGVGVGGRPDDYAAAGVPPSRRGRVFDDHLAILREVWAGGDVGPAPHRRGGPPLLFGGSGAPAMARAARWGDGVIAAVAVEAIAGVFASAEEAWRAAGRADVPRRVARLDVAIGDAALVAAARAAHDAYYANGERRDGLITDVAALRDALATLRDAGADETILHCWSPDPSQLETLAPTVPD